MFHSFYFFAAKASGVSGPSRLEGFILCPNSSVENLKDGLLCFGGEKRQVENFVSINKSSPLWQGDTIPLASCVGGWYLYKFVQFVPLLLFKNLAKVLVQRKERGCGCDGSNKFVYHWSPPHGTNKNTQFMLKMWKVRKSS
jgi:hypothetical protein